MADDGRGHAGGTGHHGRSQRVFQVMRAGNVHLVGSAHSLFRAIPANGDFILAHKRALRHLLRAGKPGHPRAQALGHGAAGRIVIVEHRCIGFILAGENAALHRRVVLHGIVTVQMILGDIEHRRHARMEGIRRFKLEAGHLSHQHILRLAEHRGGGQRIADIARHIGNFAHGAVDFPQQGYGCRFAVGARQRHQRALAQLGGNLQFARYGNVHFTGFEHNGRIDGHAGADQQHIALRQQRFSVLAQMPLAGKLPQRRQRLP